MSVRSIADRISRSQQRLDALYDALDALIGSPESHNLAGSSTITNRKSDEIRAEIAREERYLATLQTGGLVRTTPRYGRFTSGGVQNG